MTSPSTATIFSLNYDELSFIIEELSFEDRHNFYRAYPNSFIPEVVMRSLTPQKGLYLSMNPENEAAERNFQHGMECSLSRCGHHLPLLPPDAFGSDLCKEKKKKCTLTFEAIIRLKLSTKGLAKAMPNLTTLKISMDAPDLRSLVKATKFLSAFRSHKGLTCLELYLCPNLDYTEVYQVFERRSIHVEFAYLVSILNQAGAYSSLKILVLHIGACFFRDPDEPAVIFPADPNAFSLRLLNTVEKAYLRLPMKAIIANYCLLSTNPHLQELGLCSRPQMLTFLLDKIDEEAQSGGGGGAKLAANLAGKLVHLLEQRPVIFRQLELRLPLLVAHFTSLTHLYCSLNAECFLKMLFTLQTLDSLRELYFKVKYPQEDDFLDEWIVSRLNDHYRLYKWKVRMPKVTSLILKLKGSDSLLTSTGPFEQLALENVFRGLKYFDVSLNHSPGGMDQQANASRISTDQKETIAFIWKLFETVRGKLSQLECFKGSVCFAAERITHSHVINITRKKVNAKGDEK